MCPNTRVRAINPSPPADDQPRHTDTAGPSLIPPATAPRQCLLICRTARVYHFCPTVPKSGQNSLWSGSRSRHQAGEGATSTGGRALPAPWAAQHTALGQPPPTCARVLLCTCNFSHILTPILGKDCCQLFFPLKNRVLAQTKHLVRFAGCTQLFSLSPFFFYFI